MELLLHNPDAGVYAATPDYAHALEVRGASRLLFVSGTMGLDAHGAAAALRVYTIVRVTCYVRDVAYAVANGAAPNAALGGRLVPTTAIVVGTLARDWLVELEVIATG